MLFVLFRCMPIPSIVPSYADQKPLYDKKSPLLNIGKPSLMSSISQSQTSVQTQAAVRPPLQ